LTSDFEFGEPLADMIVGKIDAFEISIDDAGVYSALKDYFLFCEAGLVIPLAGASVHLRERTALGSMRTYVYMPDQDFTYTHWIESLRAGRSLVSNGPLMHWTIDGNVPTTNFGAAHANSILQIRVEAKSWEWFDHLELLWNGEIIDTLAPTGRLPCHAEIEYEFTVRESGWLAARCVTDRTHGTDPLPLAHTSAVELRLHDAPRRAKPEAVKHFLSELDGMLRFTGKIPCGRRLRHVVEGARTILAKKLSP
jgi:hypothetical protein